MEGWALIPTDDDGIRLLCSSHDELGAFFRLALPSKSSVAWALDKRAAYEFAAAHGVDHPRTWVATDESELDNPEISYPVIIKPAFCPHELSTSTPRAWRADDREQLGDVYRSARELIPADRLMLQELIPGGGECQLAYGALCRDGSVLASVAANRLRQWPVDFGRASTYVETIAEDELEGPAQTLLAASGFTGVVELEFKRDPRDGRLRLLDVNPRPWGWISIDARAGVNFSHLLYEMLLGHDVPRVHARVGVRWMRLSADAPAALAQRRAGSLGVARYVRGLRPPLACAIVARDDPVPALVDLPLLASIWTARKPKRIKPKRTRTVARRAHDVGDAGKVGPGRRALIIVENAPVPGDARVGNVALGLKQAGWEVTVLAPQAWGEPARPDEETLEGSTVRRFPLRPAEASPLGYVGEYTRAMWRIWREVRRMARDRPFDVIHACNPPDFLLLAVVGQRRRGTRLVFDQHDLGPEMYAARESARPLVERVLVLLERLAFSLADVALATNGSIGQVAVERGGMRSEDVFVVRNAPRLDRFTPVEPDRALARGRPHLLVYVGLMAPQDGVDHALRALAHLRRMRDDWHALFLGHGEMLSSLRELASELGLDGHVDFPGFVSKDTVRRAICTADVCLAPDPRNPYTDHSTLVKIAEYMALERPTVGYDLLESRVTAGDAALFASNNDPAEFARQIAKLLDSPELRVELGAKGRARIEQELSWEHSERALLAAYRRAIASRGERSATARV
jgi:predicted ATP-grasp superfamily ATP-dependent carboligase/glycosyltransferase involved in cell wall biosynthesis